MVGVLGLATVTVAAPSAQATSPRTVDPAPLQPALNPGFAPWSCWRAGAGITCQGGYEASYDEPFGSCDGRELRITGTIKERMTRWHTADGLATKTSVHLDAGDVFRSRAPTRRSRSAATGTGTTPTPSRATATAG